MLDIKIRHTRSRFLGIEIAVIIGIHIQHLVRQRVAVGLIEAVP